MTAARARAAAAFAVAIAVLSACGQSVERTHPAPPVATTISDDLFRATTTSTLAAPRTPEDILRAVQSPELLPEIRDGLPVTAHVVTSEVTTEILSFVPGVAVDETAAADTISRVRALPEHVPVVALDPFGDGSTVAVRIHTSVAGRRTAIFFPASVTPPAVAGSAFTDRTLYGVTFPSRGLSLVRVDTSRADAVTAMNGIGVTETCWRELSFPMEPQSSTATSGRSIASITKAVGEVLCNSLGRALA